MGRRPTPPPMQTSGKGADIKRLLPLPVIFLGVAILMFLFAPAEVPPPRSVWVCSRMGILVIGDAVMLSCEKHELRCLYNGSRVQEKFCQDR
jgi:hypothetical protein